MEGCFSSENQNILNTAQHLACKLTSSPVNRDRQLLSPRRLIFRNCYIVNNFPDEKKIEFFNRIGQLETLMVEPGG